MMGPLILLLLMCSGVSTATNSSDLLKPGALVAPVGRILIVEDVMTVKYNINGLLKVPPSLKKVKKDLEDGRKKITEVKELEGQEPFMKITFELQEVRIGKLIISLQTLIDNLPTHRVDVRRMAHSNRSKRGLFNVVGWVSKELFGTATADDVEKLGKKYQEITNTVTRQDRLITKVYNAVENMHENINEVIKQTNQLTTAVTLFTTLQMPSMILHVYMSEYVQIVENALHELKATNEVIISNLVDAGIGRVSSKLLPINHLLEAIQVAKGVYNLNPLFEEENVEYYYPLLEATLTNEEIAVHIPLESSDKFQAWQIEPFPIKVNNTLLTLKKTSELVLISEDLESVDITTMDALTKCKSSYHNIYVCPAYAFAFIKGEEAKCEIALTQKDASASLDHCQYVPVQNRSIFHKHIHNVNYFYFPVTTTVIVICKDEGKQIQVVGYYSAPDHCEVRSSKISTLPTRHHLALVSNLTTELINLKPFLNVHFNKMNITLQGSELLSYLKSSDFNNVLDETRPMYLSRLVLFPTFSVTSIVFIMSMLVILFYFRRMSRRFEKLENKLKKRREPNTNFFLVNQPL